MEEKLKASKKKLQENYQKAEQGLCTIFLLFWSLFCVSIAKCDFIFLVKQLEIEGQYRLWNCMNFLRRGLVIEPDVRRRTIPET